MEKKRADRRDVYVLLSLLVLHERKSNNAVNALVVSYLFKGRHKVLFPIIE